MMTKTYTMKITRENGSVVMRMEVPKPRYTNQERLRYEHEFEARQNYLDAEREVRNRYRNMVLDY